MNGQLDIKYLPVASLKPYEKNPRKHSPEQIKQLVASIKHFGFLVPVLVDGENRIIAGHGRCLAAVAAGLEEVPTIKVEHLTEDQRRAYVIADNQLTINSEWDETLLKEELAALKTSDFDLLLTGFETSALDELLADISQPIQDEVPDLPAEPTSKTGDLYILGQHRLLCGDCRKEEDMTRLMGDEKAVLLLTDPPYGISIVHAQGGTIGASKAFGSTKPGARAFGEWGSVQRGPKSPNQIIKANIYPTIQGDDKPFDPSHLLNLAEHTVLFGGNYFADKLPCRSGWLCWDKRENITRNDFADCELAWTSDNKPARIFHHLWNGLHKGSQHGERRSHPTEKPIALFSWIISEYTKENDLVLDLYAGSGVCVISAEQLKRRCFAMEIEPLYCDVVVARWEKLTGQKAVLANA